MAAEQVAGAVGSFTLTANTQAEINLTAPLSVASVQIIHHGNVPDVVFYKFGTTEAAVAIAVLGEDEAYPLPSGRRVTVNVNRDRNNDTGIWIGLRSNGAAGVSVMQFQGDLD